MASQAVRLERATKAAQNFESFFVSSMLESMYAGMKPDKLFGGGSGESMYRSLLNQQYGQLIGDRDSFGIAAEVRAEMMRAQEKQT
jgi:Rod binding domain-containing protein